MQFVHRFLDSMYLLGLIATVCSVVLFYRYFRAKEPEASEMGCGQCGYNVKGLPTHNCPECGADLRQVGITPKAGFSPTPPKELLGFAIFSGFAAIAFIFTQAALDWWW